MGVIADTPMAQWKKVFVPLFSKSGRFPTSEKLALRMIDVEPSRSNLKHRPLPGVGSGAAIVFADFFM
ncbi:hypothetical protein [Acidocella sp.]|jgi:hypothetical protein|uniref:hypothetical protein n=1 Tax=Acidocella sp. TaxID=50710 RepID=UPI002F41770B